MCPAGIIYLGWDLKGFKLPGVRKFPEGIEENHEHCTACVNQVYHLQENTLQNYAQAHKKSKT